MLADSRGARASLAVLLAVAMLVPGCGFVRGIRLPKVSVPRIRIWPRAAPAVVGEFAAAKRLYERGRYGEATAALEKWLSKHAKTPLEPVALYYLARSQYQAGKREEAAASYRLLIKDYERAEGEGARLAAVAKDELANVTARVPNLPDYEPTRRWWRPGDWLSPDLPIVRQYKAARACYRRGDYNQAIIAFTELADGNPTNPLAPACRYWVARSHEELKQAAKAREAYASVAKQFPGTEWEKHAEEGLRRLKDK